MTRRIALACTLAASLFAGSALAEGLEKGTLVFVATVAGNWDLFVLRAGESAPVRLTETPLDERAPALSADGRRVAYATSDGALWVRDLADAASVRLELPPGIYGSPSWMPDGSGIVYTSYEYRPPHEDADFFSYSFATGKTTPFLRQTGPQDFASLSPAADRVAYMSSLATTVHGFGSTVNQQLWLLSLRSGEPQQLFLGTSRLTRPAWSPDGKALAVASDRSGSTEIWIVDPDARKEPVRLTGGPGGKFTPTWSPDGSEIACISTASGRSELTIINVKTKAARRLQLFKSEEVEIREPHWR
ncbi:MAG TPA: hypothetical protein VEK57_22400 [Thermoanaerobaculia bacterium]|nr:hypothetical protein [Thermoanaerobaculia bacterium]